MEENTLFGSPTACLLSSGNADTVTARAKAAAMVLIMCMLFFLVRISSMVVEKGCLSTWMHKLMVSGREKKGIRRTIEGASTLFCYMDI